MCPIEGSKMLYMADVSHRDHVSLHLSSLSNNLADRYSMVLTSLIRAYKSAMDGAVVDFQKEDIKQRHAVRSCEARADAFPVSPLMGGPIGV